MSSLNIIFNSLDECLTDIQHYSGILFTYDRILFELNSKDEKNLNFFDKNLNPCLCTRHKINDETLQNFGDLNIAKISFENCTNYYESKIQNLLFNVNGILNKSNFEIKKEELNDFKTYFDLINNHYIFFNISINNLINRTLKDNGNLCKACFNLKKKQKLFEDVLEKLKQKL